MTDNTLLMVGAGLVFAGLVVAGLLMFRPAPTPTGVARSLLVIQQSHYNPMAPVAEPSASERLLMPAIRRLSKLGKRLTPVGTPARLQRRLDLAGNPRGWTVERILATKAAGLA